MHVNEQETPQKAMMTFLIIWSSILEGNEKEICVQSINKAPKGMVKS